MDVVNYLLLFQGDSTNGGTEASVRGFTNLEAARAAMNKTYRKFAARLNIPVTPHAFCNQFTTRTENRIRLECCGNFFQWEIIKAVPEDGVSTGVNGKPWHGRKEFTVTIEEHIAQKFSVEAYDIFGAVQSAETAYEQGSLVVQHSTPNARLIMARDDETGDATEWKEF